MTRLDFVTEPSFQCPDDEASDVAFIKATRMIGGWDAVEEYMACGLFPFSVSFNLGEIAEGETPVSNLVVPLLESPVIRRPEETNDGFQVRVELATVIFAVQYACGEHKACVEIVPNGGRVNRVFEQTSVPDLHLAPSQHNPYALRRAKRLQRKGEVTWMLSLLGNMQRGLVGRRCLQRRLWHRKA
jgi:hypothetical protein